MPQEFGTPQAHLLAGLQHHRTAQELTAGLYHVLQAHDSKEHPDPVLDRLLAPLQTALQFPSTSEESIQRLKDALEAGSTPHNILEHIKHRSSKNPNLEQALLRYDDLINKAGNLDHLLHAHSIALRLAASPDYGFTVDPQIRFGKPCIKGQRLCVYDVLEYLASGMTATDIIDDFPDLTHEDLNKCQAFAKDLNTRLQTHPG